MKSYKNSTTRVRWGNLQIILFSALLFIISNFSGISQDVRINGIIIDKQTSKPIEDVYVAWEKGQMILTGSDGAFSINISKFPTKLTFSHLSYGLTEISLSEKPEDPFYVRLDPEPSKIGEIQISGERLRILTQHNDYSIIDFEFDKNYMWMLGYVDNQVNKQRLFLANPYGDTICTIKVRRAEKLFRDAFENVHLLTRDSAFQLLSQGDSIAFLYSTPRNLFDQTMQGILCGFNNKLVYKDYNPRNFYMRLYYLCEKDHYQHHITILTDTVGQMSEKQDSKRDAIMTSKEMKNMWRTLRSGYKPGSKIAAMVLPPVLMNLFTYNDSLFVLNYFKDSLLCYSPDGKFVRAALVDFHKEKRLTGIDYKELEFVTDPISNKIYVTERRIAGWALHPFDTMTGKLLPEILLPDFAGMTGIRAYNEAIYFLYHEKLFPYFTRLYRYQL
jgi:hypothetical protein